jgi:hydrogenase maturation protease
MARPVVIIGIGNVLAGDDGVGVLAARSLEARTDLPAGIRILEAGTLGPDTLAYFEPDEAVVLIDAVRGGEPPGTMYHIELEDLRGPGPIPMSVHDLGIHHLLREAQLLDRPLTGVLLGIEPSHIELFDQMLSSPVAAALPELQAAALREAQRLSGEL